MKRLLIIVLLSTAATFSQNVSPQFSELKGMEDQSGSTHLFYRIHTSIDNDPIYEWSNHIYHWNIFAEVDTLFITASGIESPGYNHNKWVGDVDYWDNNPDFFIYSGGQTFGPFFEGSAYVQRFDGFKNYFGLFWGSANYVNVSSSNDSLVFLGINTDGGFGLLSSSDGGRSWDSLSVIYQFLSLNPHFENIYFVEDWDRRLFRTTDAGNTFNLVDPEFLPDTRFHYDLNSQYVYRKAYHKLIVSDNLGEQFSWQTVFTNSTSDPFYFSNDISVSGSIFISEGKNIYHSPDFGNSFNIYKSLEQKIVGIYKKPNSDKIYAATKYKIYEITPDTTQVIKTLPIPDEVLNLYPLAIGNKWIYDYVIDPDDPQQEGETGIYIRQVLKDTVLTNGKLYAKVYDETLNYYGTYVYERADSVSGKVFRYYEDPLLEENEYAIHDLLAEVGDTINTSRNFYGQSLYTTVLGTSTFSKWGITKPKKIFQEYSLSMLTYSLTENFGLDSIYFIFDFGYGRTELKGAIIDGVVYGDTTVVSVEDEAQNLPTEFSLDQNYPNPFNPSTTINYSISQLEFVTLKVYDVLGNEIATLVNEEKSIGSYEVEFDGSDLTSGIYFYALRSGNFNDTKKLVLLK